MKVQGMLEEEQAMAAVGHVINEHSDARFADVIINGGINLPDLNAEVEPEEMMADNVAENSTVMACQQIPTIQEDVGLTLFGINLNAPSVGQGEHGQAQTISEFGEQVDAQIRNKVDDVGPLVGGGLLVRH